MSGLKRLSPPAETAKQNVSWQCNKPGSSNHQTYVANVNSPSPPAKLHRCSALFLRNGHNDALSCLLCHSPPAATPPAVGGTQAVPTASCTSATSPQGPMVIPAAVTATPKSPGKGGLSLFRNKSWLRKSPKGADGTAVKATKKGRGKRPGITARGDGDGGGTPQNVAGTSDGGIDVGGGWIMYTDSDGFQYCWNEALQESR